MRWLRSPWVLGSVGVVVLAWVLRPREFGAPGFREVVRDPGLWSEIEGFFHASRREVERARDWNADEAAAAARRFVFEPDEDARERPSFSQPAKMLEHHVRTLEPLIVGWLRDDATRERLLKREGGGGDSDATFAIERALILLEEGPSDAVVEPLAPLIGHDDDDVRKQVAIVLGAVGGLAAVEALLPAFDDEDSFVRDYALMGIGRAEEAGRVHLDARERVFDVLLDRICDLGDAAEVLTRWDSERAIAGFRTRGYLAYSSVAFPDVVDAMTTAGTLLPRDELLAHWQRIENGEGDEWHRKRATRTVLRMLATHRDPSDRALLEGLLERDHDTAEAAAGALLASHDLEDLHEELWDREKRVGFRRLQPFEQHISAVFFLDSEVANGGFDQYFFNSSGNRWETALAGLDAMGATAHAAILRECTGRFPGGPSTNRDTRWDQLAALSQGDDSAFDDADTRWYAAQPIGVAIARYAIEHWPRQR